MREIEFRGKRVDNGEWVYGSLLTIGPTTKQDAYICGGFVTFQKDEYGLTTDEYGLTTGDWVRVDPETVGQFTGLCDKNGKKIYEGDIVEIEYFPDLPTTREHEIIRRMICEWCEDGSFHLVGKDGMPYSIGYSGSAVKDVRVIGNIHDNPELLRG